MAKIVALTGLGVSVFQGSTMVTMRPTPIKRVYNDLARYEELARRYRLELASGELATAGPRPEAEVLA